MYALLQRRANHELRKLREIVQEFLDSEEQIRLETDQLVGRHDMARQRRREMRFCDWEKYRYLPDSELIRQRTEQNFPHRRKQLNAAFSSYLDHMNRVVS